MTVDAFLLLLAVVEVLLFRFRFVGVTHRKFDVRPEKKKLTFFVLRVALFEMFIVYLFYFVDKKKCVAHVHQIFE